MSRRLAHGSQYLSVVVAGDVVVVVVVGGRVVVVVVDVVVVAGVPVDTTMSTALPGATD